MSKWEALLAIHNFSELKSLAYNAKIRTSLKFLLIRKLLLSTFRIFFLDLHLGILISHL